MDDNSRPALSSGRNPNSYQFNGKLMLVSVVVLFAVCIIVVCYHTYARWVLHRRARHLRRNRHRVVGAHQSDPSSDPESQTHRGLDPSVLKSLPTFLYASAANDPSLECAVCLSEFEEKETGRVLPKCNHYFHIDCIDMWFHSHSNCPLCRAPVQPVLKIQPAKNRVDTVLSVSEPASTDSELDTRVRPGCSSTSLHAGDGGKLTDLVTITVER